MGSALFGPLQRGVGTVPAHRGATSRSRARPSIIHSTYCSGLEDVLPELARRGRVSFDFSDHVHDGYADDLLPFVHVAEFSAAALDDRDCAELTRWAAARGPAYVLVTRGSKGAMLFDGAVSVSVRAASSVVIDSLGAGDSFIGRALYGLIRGEPSSAAGGERPRGSADLFDLGGLWPRGARVHLLRRPHERRCRRTVPKSNSARP